MSERIDYDEFGLFHENAQEYGLPFDAPPIVRRASVVSTDGRRVSALVWGDGDADDVELVFVHGGSQNAHTWDTTIMALGRRAVAVDLPGHGHSDWRDDGNYTPQQLADDVAAAVSALAPRASVVVGMSLGGLTSMELAVRHPHLVRSLVMVDITPGGERREGQGGARLRQRAAGLPELRVVARAHHRTQPDAHGQLAAARHPPQREAARRRQLAVALRPPWPRSHDRGPRRVLRRDAVAPTRRPTWA
jgi:pimeloyl-ACP methyl ester carboxylesterase